MATVSGQPLRFEMQTVVLLVGRVLAYGVTMAIPLVLVRTMTPELFGTYKQLFLVFATLWAVLQVGLSESLYYFIPGEPGAKGAYVGHALLVFVVLGGVGCLGLWAGRDAIAGVLHNPGLAPNLPILGIYLWLMLPSCLLETVMIVERRAVWAAVTFAGSEGVKMAAVVGPAVLGGGIAGILWGSVLHAGLRLVATAWYLRRVGWPLGSLSWDTARRHWTYATPLGVAALISLIQTSADQYVVSSVYGAATFAVYAVGLFQIPIVELVGTVTASTFMVELARLRGRPEASVALWHGVTARLATVCFPVCGFAVFWAPELIEVLFTNAYEASVPIFRVVSCGAVLAPLLTDAVLRVYADTPWILRVNVIKLLLAVGLLPTVAAWGNLWGVALVGVLITLAGKMLMLKRVGGVLKVRIGDLLPWSKLAVIALQAAGPLIPAAWVSHVWAESSLQRLGVGLIVYGATYGAVLAADRSLRRAASRARPVAYPLLRDEQEAP